MILFFICNDTEMIWRLRQFPNNGVNCFKLVLRFAATCALRVGDQRHRMMGAEQAVLA